MNIFNRISIQNLSTIIFILLLASGCSNEPNQDIADIDLDLEVVRTDQLLYQCAKSLNENPDANPFDVYETYLKSEREFLLNWVNDRVASANIPDKLKDSIIVDALIPVLADPNVFHLLDTIQEVFPEDFPLEATILPTLKRFKKFFPDIQIPKIRTHADGYVAHGDIRSVDQVMYMPNFFSFGLHYFIGGDYPYYPRNVAQFIRNRFSSEYINVALAHQLASVHVKPLPASYETKLIDHVIHSGIKQYMVDQLLPNTPDSLKMFYTAEQMRWADYFEAKVYNEILQDIHKMDLMVLKRYLDDKPHSTHLSLESAPRLGQYAGWKIVSAYMEKNPDVSLAQLSQMTDYDRIFRLAKYKPVDR